MLPLINLPVGDAAISSREMPANTELTGNFTEFESTFGALLRAPVPIGQDLLSAVTGENLPPDGNELPQAEDGNLPEIQPQTGPEPPLPEFGAGQLKPLPELVAPATTAPQATTNPVNIAIIDIDNAGLKSDSTLPSQTQKPIPRVVTPEAHPIAASGTPAASQILTEARMPVKSSRPNPGVPAEFTNLPTDKMLPAAPMTEQSRLQSMNRHTNSAATPYMPGPAAVNPSASIIHADAQLAADGNIPDQFEAKVKPAAISGAQPQPAISDSHALQSLPGGHARVGQANPVTTSIGTPVLDSEWGNALNERVLWLADRGIQRAEIRLHPAELGPVSVRISVEDEAAQVAFISQHPLTREAIEAAMPRLREMFVANGLDLNDASVSDSDGREESQSEAADSSSRRGTESVETEDLSPTETAIRRNGSSSALVDTFA